MTASSFPMAVLISGGGTTLKNLIDCVERGELAVEIRTVISSNPQAGGLQFAKSAGIPTEVVERPSCDSPAAFRDAVFDICRAAEVQLVVMGGFLKHLLIPADFAGKVLNIHPSLIPQFCGQGFYGARVHSAVLESGVDKTGCTVHVVDNEYDHGPIVLQREVPVLLGDSVEKLAARVFVQECQALPEAIRLFAENRVQVSKSNIIVDPA
jgi:phosphoribosylglycinamide formyltransferase-1